MNYSGIPYRIFPLGDTALTIDFGNAINDAINREVIARFNQLQEQPLPGMLEAIPAYSSLTVYYNVYELRRKIKSGKTVFEWMKEQLEERMKTPVQEKKITERLIKIPVCYQDEFAADIQQLAATKNISAADVVQIHTSINYKVYMLGFLPGFAYMGEVDERITMSRKPQPLNVVAGSVGIAGKQTGIYPLASPGGWQIIGRTPLKLFKAPPTPPEGEASKDSVNSDNSIYTPTLLKAGDMVQFYSITKIEFEQINAKE